MAAASLPDELLARVLSPVDLKSLVQARAVCNSWQTSVEGKQVSDLRATTVTAGAQWPFRHPRHGRRAALAQLAQAVVAHHSR